MGIAGVIFDFNGTLFWDTDKNEAAWQAFALRHAGRKISPREFLGLHGQPNREWLGFLMGYIPSDPADVLALAEEKEVLYRKMCLDDPEGFCLAPGVAELLDRLAARDIPRAIATSSDEKNVGFYTRHMGLDKWFGGGRIVYNDGSLKGKPAPDIYLAAARAIGLKPEQCAVVEDAPIGVRAAHAAGIGRVVGIQPGSSGALERDPYVDVLIHDFNNPESWLDALK